MPDSTVTAARLQAVHAWQSFTTDRNLKAVVPDWRTRTAADGRPVLSAEVAGPGAAHALRLFAGNYYLALPQSGDLRPFWDVDVPGRTVLVWRSGGVWVELWHPDTVTSLPAAPAQPVRPVQAREGLLSRASARLPYTRRATKETSR
ncbi:putative PCQ3_100 (plasmid) [Streptomyces ambofaciens ATCC 23877]|uniref:Putative PCQ3_100 n=1 Tax=Streptomyces ambofaciens (strain ATCC 23877 / 3486 / DSM 40053 / JCM 4204 / NBRC 12836 / NRRL B-2516) TaxID=278992 RepID=A0A0K2B698_STRA7|nr:hypothetical protein [Streptomyces ambofaciens]AKZ60758.1 putative PCQ3_100 [Streptomyces ambofaciens ATCC 23877]